MRMSLKVIGFSAIILALFAQSAFTLAAQVKQEGPVLVQPSATQAEELPALPPPQRHAESPEPADTRKVSHPGQDSVRVREPYMRPVHAENVIEEPASPSDEPIPAPVSGEQIVYPVRNIKYDTDRGARRMYAGSDGVIETVMITKNPADGCLYEIPLCLPACCVGEPMVDHRLGLLGRGVVEYCWPCGLEVEVKFRLRGDVKVDYDG